MNHWLVLLHMLNFLLEKWVEWMRHLLTNHFQTLEFSYVSRCFKKKKLKYFVIWLSNNEFNKIFFWFPKNRTKIFGVFFIDFGVPLIAILFKLKANNKLLNNVLVELTMHSKQSEQWLFYTDVFEITCCWCCWSLNCEF